MTVRRLVVAGLAPMAAAVLASAIWPAVATAISAVLAVLVLATAGVGVVLAARLLRAGLFARRAQRSQLATSRSVDAAPSEPSSSLAELSESA